MRIQAKIWKDGKCWIAEAPVACVVTQGKSEADGAAMLKEAIDLLLESYKLPGKVAVIKSGRSWFVESNEAGLVALILRNQRAFNELSLSQASRLVGQSSKNSVARYEQAKAEPTLSKLEELLSAVAPKLRLQIV